MAEIGGDLNANHPNADLATPSTATSASRASSVTMRDLARPSMATIAASTRTLLASTATKSEEIGGLFGITGGGGGGGGGGGVGGGGGCLLLFLLIIH